MSGFLLPSVGSARKKSAKKKYEAALRAREKAGGDLETFRRVLYSQEAKTATDQVQFSGVWAEQQTDGPSTQKLDRADCTLDMTMTSYDGGHPWADLNWTIEIGFTLSDNDGGERPDDFAGLTFEPRDYDYVSGSAYGSSLVETRKSGYKGAILEWPDVPCDEYQEEGASCPPDVGTTVTIDAYAGIQVKPDETSDPTYRKVYGDFQHTYSEVTVDSVGFDTAGEITVNLSDETKKWDNRKEASISEDELVYKNCC